MFKKNSKRSSPKGLAEYRIKKTNIDFRLIDVIVEPQIHTLIFCTIFPFLAKVQGNNNHDDVLFLVCSLKFTCATNLENASSVA